MGATDVTVSHVVRAPHPVAATFAARLAAAYGKNINGRAGSIHAGEKYARSRRFSGWLAPQQTFTGAAWFANNAGLQRTPKIAPARGLPNTQAPLADLSPILAGLQNGQLYRGQL